MVIVDGRLESNSKKVIQNNISNCLFFGITAMSGSPILDALDIARYVRGLNPEIPLVWGGFHPTLVPDTTAANHLVDIIAIGQGEDLVLELADALENNKPLEKIKGIFYKKDGQVHINEARELININEHPGVDYSLINPFRYFKNDANTKTIDYISSRGCPFTCKFCCISKLYGRKYYQYPAQRVIGDIESLHRKYGINGIRFMDDNFFANKRRIIELCNGLIERDIKIKWWAMCRVDDLLRFDNEFWDLIKRAGLTILNIGAESGSNRILERISKKITSDMIVRAADLCVKEPDRNYMINFWDRFDSSNRHEKQLCAILETP